MKKVTYLILGGMLLFTMSCNNTNTDTGGQEHASEAMHEHHHAEEEHGNTIQLNDGQKWEVNVEMIPFIESGSDLLKSYVASNGTDYKSLAAQIKDADDNLIKSCTMDGTAHDELHKWLHPHLELVQKLSEAENTEVANELIAKLNRSYETYHKYFQ